MVVHFVPAHRVVALLESLTGAAPSVGFVHGMLARTAGLLTEVHDRIRTLITLSYAVACDETPLKVGPKTPEVGKKKAERYLLVACTELYTHYLLLRFPRDRGGMDYKECRARDTTSVRCRVPPGGGPDRARDEEADRPGGS
jgi:hypothetical protein